MTPAIREMYKIFLVLFDRNNRMLDPIWQPWILGRWQRSGQPHGRHCTSALEEAPDDTPSLNRKQYSWFKRHQCARGGAEGCRASERKARRPTPAAAVGRRGRTRARTSWCKCDHLSCIQNRIKMARPWILADPSPLVHLALVLWFGMHVWTGIVPHPIIASRPQSSANC
jgi:hypothetical protein